MLVWVGGVGRRVGGWGMGDEGGGLIASRLRYQGSPAFVGCWEDEGHNLKLKKLCQGAYALHWHARVLMNWETITGKKRSREDPT